MGRPVGDGGVRLRKPELRDAPRIAELSGQLGYPATAEEVARRLERIERDPLHAVAVAELPDGQVVGWIHVHEQRSLMDDARVEIAGLIVADDHRSRGAGRVLMEYAEEWARERGCHTVVLRSNVIRTRAHAFYERLGYEVVKSQKYFRKELPSRR